MPLEKNCEICKKIFLVKQSHYSSSFCCSNECKRKRLQYALLGDKNPNYKNAGNKICLKCQRQYKSYNKKSKYCSHLCADISNRKDERWSRREYRSPRKKETKPRKINKIRVKKTYICIVCNKINVSRNAKYCKSCRHTKDKIKINCEICGKEKLCYKSRIAKFCSKKCQLSAYTGLRNPNYIDGRTPENKKIRASQEYKNWRRLVFERDKFTCQHCGQIGWELHADHIKPFSQYPDLRLDLSNGRTLCRSCHEKTPTWLSGSLKKYNKNGGIADVITHPDQLESLLK